MTADRNNRIDFAETMAALENRQVWQYETWWVGSCADVALETFEALQRPSDFPPMDAAIVAGDRVALAVDPNVPSLMEVIDGAIKALGHTDASAVEIVLWDEASDELVDQITAAVGEGIGVFRHVSSDRSNLRYLGASQSADPIYLNRRLVDADFVLPIVSGRPLDTCFVHDLTGVFPWFADSRSRARYHAQVAVGDEASLESLESIQETSWLLGVQIMLAVTASDSGHVAQVIAGTPDALRKALTPSRRLPDGFPPAAPLVIASLDGDAQQQSWANAARAVAAASRFTQPGGTIVLWSDLGEEPSGRLQNATDPLHEDELLPTEPTGDSDEEEFPLWDATVALAGTFGRVASEYRVLVHSRLDAESVEAMGLASLDSVEELTRLSRSFDSCGVLRAAQYAGTTVDMPIQLAKDV